MSFQHGELLTPLSPSFTQTPSPVKCRSGSESPIKLLDGASLPIPASPFKTTGLGVLSSPTRRLRGRATSFGNVGGAVVRDMSAGRLAMHDGLRCRTESNECSGSLSVVGLRCQTESNMNSPAEAFVGTRCRTVSNMSSASQHSPLKTHRACLARPLPQTDVDWLLSSLDKEDLKKFNSRFFNNDSQRRFRELDTDGSGFLGNEKLRYALVDMFPTLKLELLVEGHHIPPLDKSIPGLIATFDSDADGYLDFEDFVRFVKFQHAWRSQFFLSKVPRCKEKAVVSKDAKRKDVRKKNMNSSCSLPNLDVVGSAAGKRPPTQDNCRHVPMLPSRPCTSHSDLAPLPHERPSTASFKTKPRTSLTHRGAFYSSLLGLSSTI